MKRAKGRQSRKTSNEKRQGRQNGQERKVGEGAGQENKIKDRTEDKGGGKQGISKENKLERIVNEGDAR